MNVSSYVTTDVSFSFSSAPHLLWDYYMQYLWNYDAASWVATVSLTVRVLAVLLIAPLVILGMLDVSSYVVARTLGVVDVAKASTNGGPIELTNKSKSRDQIRRELPSIIVSSPPLTPELSHTVPPFATGSSTSESFTPPPNSENLENDGVSGEHADGLAELMQLDDSVFSNEKLYGVGVFSPASSRPPSPTISRRKHLPFTLIGEDMADDAAVRKRRKNGVTGAVRDSSEE